MLYIVALKYIGYIDITYHQRVHYLPHKNLAKSLVSVTQTIKELTRWLITYCWCTNIRTRLHNHL